jgi:predicted Rossmann-fold nucleotide-binding protein
MQARADAFIVLKGSMGTLAELALVWNLAKIDAQHRKPIILLGDAWARVLRVMCEQLTVTEEEARLLRVAKKPEEAVGLLDGLLVG